MNDPGGDVLAAGIPAQFAACGVRRARRIRPVPVSCGAERGVLLPSLAAGLEPEGLGSFGVNASPGCGAGTLASLMSLAEGPATREGLSARGHPRVGTLAWVLAEARRRAAVARRLALPTSLDLDA
jgi:hypothetical protein